METEKLRTLIIEDNLASAELLKEMLAKSVDVEFLTQTAGSLADGLEWLAQDRFDLVLLDLTLPDARGASTCRAIIEAAPSLPIVIVSGSSESDGCASECLQMGAQGYLTKGDFDGRHLIHSVRYAIRRKGIEHEYENVQNALLEANRNLTEKVRELDRLNAVMMGREERILELKDELRGLKERLSKRAESAL